MKRRDDVLERLSEANPVVPEDAALRALAERVVTIPRPRRRTRRLAVAALAAIATVVVLLVTLPIASTPPATAAEVLRRASEAAASLEPPPDEPYVYRRSVALELTVHISPGGPWSSAQHVEYEEWFAADGSGRNVTRRGDVIFPGPGDEDRWLDAGGREFATGTSDDRLGQGEFPFDDLDALPLEPSDLDRRLRQEVSEQGQPIEVAVLERAGLLLARGDASPELRASLYRVVAGLDGVHLIGEVVDPLGRQGTAVSLRFASRGAILRSVLVFDPATSALLATETQLLEPADWIDAEIGDVIESVAYVEYGVAATVEARPEAG